jgi:hypothetical protein
LLLIFLSIVVVVVSYDNYNEPLIGRSTIWLLIVFVTVTASYFNELKPSKKRYRFGYIFLIGGLFGVIIWVFTFGIGIRDLMSEEIGLSDGETLVLSFLISYGLGALIGDLFGRYRKYKGAGYAPKL